MSEILYHVETDSASFGIVVDSETGVIVEAAPIVGSYIGKLFEDVREYLYQYSKGNFYTLVDGQRVYVPTKAVKSPDPSVFYDYSPLYVDDYLRGMGKQAFDRVLSKIQDLALNLDDSGPQLREFEIFTNLLKMMLDYKADRDGYLEEDDWNE